MFGTLKITLESVLLNNYSGINAKVRENFYYYPFFERDYYYPFFERESFNYAGFSKL